MTNPPPNRVTVGGVTRFVAYTARGEWSGIHCECAACGTHFTIDRPYFYTDDDGDKQPL